MQSRKLTYGLLTFLCTLMKSLYLGILKLPSATNATELMEKLLTSTYGLFFEKKAQEL